jgi:sugar phosphate isomerase/epimerase
MARICAVTGCFEKLNLAATLDQVQKAGFRCLETWQLEGWHCGDVNLTSAASQGRPDPQVVERYTRRLLELTRARNISITVVGAFNDFVQACDRDLEREIEHVRACIRIARSVGATMVRVMGGEPKYNLPITACLERIVEGYRAVIPDARDAGVTLALENHGYITNHAPTVLHLLDRVGSPLLRCNLDASNYRWAGYPVQKVYEFYRLIAPYTAYAHLKNGHGRGGFVRSYTATTLAAGEMDLRLFVQTLANAGFDGEWGIEYEGQDDPTVAAADNLRFAGQLLAEFGYKVEAPQASAALV